MGSRCGVRLGRSDRRAPDAAAHVGQHVLQLGLRAGARPAVGRGAEREVLAATVGAEADRVHGVRARCGAPRAVRRRGGPSDHPAPTAPARAGRFRGRAEDRGEVLLAGMGRSRLCRLLNDLSLGGRGSVQAAHPPRGRHVRPGGLDGFPALRNPDRSREAGIRSWGRQWLHRRLAFLRCQPSERRSKRVSLPR